MYLLNIFVMNVSEVERKQDNSENFDYTVSSNTTFDV